MANKPEHQPGPHVCQRCDRAGCISVNVATVIGRAAGRVKGMRAGKSIGA